MVECIDWFPCSAWEPDDIDLTFIKDFTQKTRLSIGRFYTFVVQGNDLHCYIDFYWKMCFSIYLCVLWE